MIIFEPNSEISNKLAPIIVPIIRINHSKSIYRRYSNRNRFLKRDSLLGRLVRLAPLVSRLGLTYDAKVRPY
jgi:hypothetical protein